MPTLSADVQAVLATDKVRFQHQEVAFVVADTKYIARDALELIEVDYEPLPAVVDAKRALEPDAPGDPRRHRGQDRQPHLRLGVRRRAARRTRCSTQADVVVTQEILYPRVHPAPMETCGTVAHMDPVTGKLTVYSTNQAPHAHRTIYALVAGIPEHKIRIISPDIGGGFGNKVGIYPGTCWPSSGSIVTGRPGQVDGGPQREPDRHVLRPRLPHDRQHRGDQGRQDPRPSSVDVLADHGAFNGTAQPTKFPAGFFHIFTGSYDLQAAHCTVTGVYTNKAPGGVAYACSFRITEAVYLVERMVDILAAELKIDPAELRMKNLLRPEQFPYISKTGWEYDSGDYPRALQAGAGHGRVRRAPRANRPRSALAAS